MRIAEIDIGDDSVAADVLALQRRAYTVEAKLIGSDAIPPLQETQEELRMCGERFLGAFVDHKLAGIVSWKLDASTLDIHRLAVDPDSFRRGIATTLVRAVLRVEPGATRAVVQTGARNEPARALYVREGFASDGERDVAEGIRVATFSREL